MNLNLKVKAPGKKNLTVKPELSVGPTHNRIVMNNPLVDKMGIEEGDYVVIMKDEDSNSYYLGRVSEADVTAGKIDAAKTAGKGALGFSYAGPWLELFTNDLDKEVDLSTALRDGILVKKENGSGYYTTRKVKYDGEIHEFDEPVEVNGVEFDKLFELGTPYVLPYNYSKNVDKEGEDDMENKGHGEEIPQANSSYLSDEAQNGYNEEL